MSWHEAFGRVRILYKGRELPGSRTDTQIQATISRIFREYAPPEIEWTSAPLLFDDRTVPVDPDEDFRIRRIALVRE